MAENLENDQNCWLQSENSYLEESKYAELS